jgi:hypothetical protein
MARFVLPILLCACGAGSGAQSVDGGDIGVPCTPGGTFDLDGRAGVLGLLNVHIDASGLVETDTTSELLLYMDVTQSGTDVDVVATVCGIDIPDVPIAGQDQPISFDVSAETIASVAGVAGMAELSSPDQRCATFESKQFTIVLGALLDPIDTAALPEAGEDGSFRFCAPTIETSCDLAIGLNCACDQEGDGKGGATLRAANVPIVDLDEVYVTLRTSFRLSGVVFDSDLVAGTIDASLEQGVLGCHLATGEECGPGHVGSIKQLNPVITQQPANPSTYRAVRVPDEMTCAELIDAKSELFPL